MAHIFPGRPGCMLLTARRSRTFPIGLGGTRCTITIHCRRTRIMRGFGSLESGICHRAVYLLGVSRSDGSQDQKSDCYRIQWIAFTKSAKVRERKGGCRETLCWQKSWTASIPTHSKSLAYHVRSANANFG